MQVVDMGRPDLGGNIRHGDASTFCPLLWAYLIDRFAIRSILDVGCGEGHAVRWFARRGVFAHGIDGLELNIERAVVPIAHHDLTSGAYRMPVDLVWSCEVAEHISADFVDDYIKTLANGTIIAMTHAIPGQGGHHHVNCQPPEYWVTKLEWAGYSLSGDNELFRSIAGKDDGWNYFQKSGLVFLRR